MLKISSGMYEKCASDKAPQKLIMHLNCAVHYIVDGEGWFNGKKLGKGDGFVTRKNDFVNYFPDRENPWTYVWFRLEGEDTEELFIKSGIPQKSEAFAVRDVERIEKTALALFGLNKPYEPKNVTESESIAKIMLALNCEADSENERDYAQNAKQFIDGNFHKRITVEDVASHVNVERKYLRVLFVKKYGLSTMDYIMKKRMDRAKELLQKTSAPISDVALSVGYDDALGFSRIFKKYVGSSPKVYRNTQIHLPNL